MERESRLLWVMTPENKMEYKSVEITPGLYKIFDEILVNASDNSVRVPNMTEIKVEINSINKSISV